jgi:ABC-type transporter Mla maintaining outer membrane lipid asymmetry ATPase subunit MlaF
MDSVYEYSDYTAFIKEGRIKWYGQSKSIKSSKNNDLKNFIMGIS